MMLVLLLLVDDVAEEAAAAAEEAAVAAATAAAPGELDVIIGLITEVGGIMLTPMGTIPIGVNVYPWAIIPGAI